MKSCWIVALLGCGRFSFEPIETAGNGSLDAGDAMTDASTTVRAWYIKASNTEAFDDFGYALALSADGLTLAVGAPQEDSSSATNQNDNAASNAGAVYIFVRSGSTWQQQAYLKPSARDAGDLFGAAVALSADGNTLIASALGEDSTTVGVNTTPDNNATDSGAAYVFVRAGGTWSQQAYLKASNTDPGDRFGAAVAISATGDVVAIGADAESSNASGVNGNQANNLALASGAVYVFARAGTVWSQDAYVKASNTQASDNFGAAIALSADGTALVVAAPGEDGGGAIGGNQADNTVTDAGAAYVFVRSATWSQQAYLKAPAAAFGDFFCKRMSLAASGGLLLCSAPGEDSLVANSGAAYVLAQSGSTWAHGQTLKASNAGDNDQFGIDVALAGDGNTLIVGAALEDSAAAGSGGDELDNSSMDSGAVYAFDRAGTAWTQYAYAKPLVPSPGDNYGFATAISGDGRTKAASLPTEDGAATGVDGAVDENAMNSGAVIVTYE